MTNIALVGANFVLKGYFPAIKIKKFNSKFYVEETKKNLRIILKLRTIREKYF